MQSHAYLIRAFTGGKMGHALAQENRVPMLLYEAGTAISEVCNHARLLSSQHLLRDHAPRL